MWYQLLCKSLFTRRVKTLGLNWNGCGYARRDAKNCRERDIGLRPVYSDATQLNSARRRVELRRYKRALRRRLEVSYASLANIRLQCQ